jgi:hemin uptake protein HemP
MTARPDDTPAREPAPALRPRRISSRTLFGESREVVIEHQGEQYRLRITSLGKLILTK